MYSEIMLSEECTKLDITIKMNQLKIKIKMKSFRVKKNSEWKFIFRIKSQ